ncbi:MAG: ATP-grasp domain-containing protein [Planctomycetes bacterium]|nr:ATP-grasp domain-containing protein [Planctomycetota bacterium]
MQQHVAFVVPFRFETSLRFLRAALDVPGCAVSLVTQEAQAAFEPDLVRRLAGFQQVKDALSASSLVDGVRQLAQRLGRVDRLIGVLEQLQVPLAEARAALRLPGLSVDAAVNFREKSRMKDVLRAAGLPCARHAKATSLADVRSFVAAVGYPLVMKPIDGAGARNTFRIENDGQLAEALGSFPPHATTPMMLEEFIVGDEHSYDAVAIRGDVVWHSISRYSPSPLTVKENDWIQWTVLLPREIDGPEFAGIRAVGPRALSVLGVGTQLCHMEWFRRKDGSVAVSEVGARPPGAQFTTLMSWCHDVDMYKAWARLMVHDTFDPPQRKFAAGAAYLRGQGHGKVVRIHGLDVAQKELGHLVVEVRLPKPGQEHATTYEGDGYVILRHPETKVVEDGLKRLVSIVRVELQ